MEPARALVPLEPPLLADHLALDLLNTEAESEGEHVDFWQSGDDVLRWLERVGAASPASCTGEASDALLASAKSLRRTARHLIEQRKLGRKGDPRLLNAWLRQYRRYPTLEWSGNAGPTLEWYSDGTGPEQWLGALALAVAELIADGAFHLVRQCEHPDCVLWFYDRTKAHRRKWCSMALCGNRHKVANHRKRMSE